MPLLRPGSQPVAGDFERKGNSTACRKRHRVWLPASGVAVQLLFPATDWSRAAIPSNRAPRVDAASGGASITTLPLGARRTWSCEKNSRTSAAEGSAATAAGTVPFALECWRVARPEGGEGAEAERAPFVAAAVV